MMPDSSDPGLARIGREAFSEVLATLLSKSVAIRESSGIAFHDDAPDLLASTIRLIGPKMDGDIQVHLPAAFAMEVARIVTGPDASIPDTSGARIDAAGEIANMVAGRVADRLASQGFSVTLGTPVVHSTPCSRLESLPGTRGARIEVLCGEHPLMLEIRCRQPVH